MYTSTQRPYFSVSELVWIRSLSSDVGRMFHFIGLCIFIFQQCLCHSLISLLFIGTSKYLICSVQEPQAINEFKFGGLTNYLCKSHKSNLVVNKIC